MLHRIQTPESTYTLLGPLCRNCDKSIESADLAVTVIDSRTNAELHLICQQCAGVAPPEKPKRARKPRKKVEETPVEADPEPELIEEPEVVIDETELPPSDDDIITE